MSEEREASPTIRDVARVAGVSIGSVSRVVNGKSSVTDEIRKRVEGAIGELGFQPNPAAQTMRNRTTRTVGCIIRDINIPVLAKFVRAASDVLLDAGYALLLANSQGIAERERQLISVMVARKADALLIGPYSETDPDLLGLLRRTKLPVVLIDRAEPPWADAVLVDHRRGVRQATDKLLRLGHRQIALLTGHESLFPAQERIKGFREAFRAREIECPVDLLRTGSFERDFGFEQTSLLLARSQRPTAIVIGGIDMLPGVIRAIRVREFSIPRDISIVAALDSDLTELFDPPISVERWDYAEVGRLAARFALDRILKRDTGEPKRVIVPTEFVMRDSISGPPATLPHPPNETLS